MFDILSHFFQQGWHWLMLFMGKHQVLVMPLLLVLGAIVVTWFAKIINNRLRPHLEKTAHLWDDALLSALFRPFLVFIWLMVVVIVAQTTLSTFYHFKALKDLHIVHQVLVILFLLWVAMRFIRKLQDNLMKGAEVGTSKADRTTVTGLSQLLRVLVILIAALVILQTFGISISALLAFGGVSGIAVGFAAKDTLSNFLGGLMIILDKPFKVGDWIRSPDREIEGTVEYIGWRLTRIRTFDKRPLYIPNGVFSTITVENPSRMLNRRIRTTIGIRYDDAQKIKDITSDIEKMLRDNSEIDTRRTLMVSFIEFGASTLDVQIYAFTKTVNWEKYRAVQQDVFLKAIDIITGYGAECAFPTTTLHIPDGVAVRSN